jgi:hypothetical protein
MFDRTVEVILLVAITGTNLTGNEVVFTQTMGGGTELWVEQQLMAILYHGKQELLAIYDEESFTVTINMDVDDITNGMFR